MKEQLAECWNAHPPLHFIGLAEEEAGDLPFLPLGSGVARESWCAMVLDGVQSAVQRGYQQCYLLLEEHLPLGECAANFLSNELPKKMGDVQGCYVSLMGWDNRRYLKRGTPLRGALEGWLHLNTPEAPRFHLHPAWWRLDVLQVCLEQTIKQGGSSAWDFEKVNEKWSATHLQEWKNYCYQINGNVHAIRSRRGIGKLSYSLETHIFHLLMRLYPAFAKMGLGGWFWEQIGFDNFFFQGPYPMFFSGVMAKGGINHRAAAFFQQTGELRLLGKRLDEARRGVMKVSRGGFAE